VDLGEDLARRRLARPQARDTRDDELGRAFGIGAVGEQRADEQHAGLDARLEPGAHASDVAVLARELGLVEIALDPSGKQVFGGPLLAVAAR